jgi:hypothetical protein
VHRRPEQVMELQTGKPLTVESLQLELVGPSELRMAGRLSDEGAQASVTGHLDALDAAIVVSKRKAFTVDVRMLDFVSSSAIRVFVNWISKAERAGYKLVFKIDRAITWHRLSFSVLKSLAPKSVDVVDEPLRGAEVKS